MVSPDAVDSPVSSLICQCGILPLSLGVCLLDLESMLCNMALLWAVGSEQGLGPPEMESVFSPTPLECRAGGWGMESTLAEPEGQQKHPSSVDLEDGEGQEVGRTTVFSLEK